MPLIFSFICLSKTGDPLSSITAGILQDGALPLPCTSEETNGAKTMVFPFWNNPWMWKFSGTPQEERNRASSNGCLVSKALCEAGGTGFSQFSQGLLLPSTWGAHLLWILPTRHLMGTKESRHLRGSSSSPVSSLPHTQLIWVSHRFLSYASSVCG